MSGFEIGQKVIHPLHGIGTVEKIEEKNILGMTSRFSEIYFSGERLRVMLNLSLQNLMIRELISKEEIPKIFKFMRNCHNKLAARSSERYNINMKKIKSADIYKMAEVIKDLSDLKKTKKLSSKEDAMLKQTKRILSCEVSYVNDISQEEAEEMIEVIMRENEAEIDI